MARSFIKAQYLSAKKQGWIPYFAAAAVKYDFPVALLMAIASRETNMKNIRGDYRYNARLGRTVYNGYGIMQVDINTDQAWCLSGKWQNVDEAIMHGTKILDEKRDDLQKRWSGERTLSQFLWVLAASYNHGAKGSYEDFKAHGSPDLHTTKHDYGADVLGRMKDFQELLNADGIVAADPDTHPAPPPPAPVESAPAPALPVEGGAATDQPVDLATTAPVKSGGFKAIIAAVFASAAAAVQLLGIEVREVFTEAKDALAFNPLMTITVVLTFVTIMVIFWRYMDRQTKLDLQREANAHARDLANQQTMADPNKVNVIVTPPVPASQEPAQG